MLQQIIDTELNPAIAAHGGYINLLAVEGDTAYIEMGGGCVGCGMVDVTLKQGVEASIIGVVPGIERVVDQTDHASGTNPYYAPSKK
jgi:Fe/S biogenesis protein NfuA